MPQLDVNSYSKIIKYAPIPLFWNGWESNTYNLINMGWDIWANETMDLSRGLETHITIIVAPKERPFILKGLLNIPLAWGDSNTFSIIDRIKAGVHMQQYTANTNFQLIKQITNKDWDSMMNAQPVFNMGLAGIPMNVPYECVDLSKTKFFTYEEESSQDILISKASIDECLNQILKVQYPVHKEALLSEGIAKPVIKAKIYQLAA